MTEIPIFQLKASDLLRIMILFCSNECLPAQIPKKQIGKTEAKNPKLAPADIHVVHHDLTSFVSTRSSFRPLSSSNRNKYRPHGEDLQDRRSVPNHPKAHVSRSLFWILTFIIIYEQ